MTDDRFKLTREEAIAMLPDGEYIHTFSQAGSALLGADWARVDIIVAILKYGFELSGEHATKMGHGMVFLDEVGHMFVATKVIKR